MSENILIASLGESPVVVTAMFDLLTTKEKQEEIGEIKKVVVLRPRDNGDDISLGYDLIVEALQGKCELLAEQLPFEDANGESESFDFLKQLYRLLDTLQRSGDSVYLSLAGGRKNMSALMALLAPLFSCVKKLYHVLDTDEKQFKSTEAIVYLSDADRKAYVHPPLDRLNLVEIPYGERQHISPQLRSLLFDLTPEQLDDLWEKNPALAESAQFYGSVSSLGAAASEGQPDITGKILRVFVTEHVKTRYKEMQDRDATRASRFADFFEQMRYADTLADKKLHLHGYIEGTSPEGKPMVFHYFKRRRTAERPFYYTWPEGIHRYPHTDVRKVIICDLAIEQGDGSYDPPTEVSLEAAREATKTYLVEKLLSSGIDSVLLVPLGTKPMIATQLYVLLKEQGYNIREVALLYPGRSNIVKASAKLVREALEDEGVPCRDMPIRGLEDIDSRENCIAYGRALEEAIVAVREAHPNCEIDLALSGGRKGMAALAMFAAQRQGIRYLYHTLINDEELEKRVDAVKTGATIKSLNSEPRNMRRERLFLRAYGGPEAGFGLFKVPVIPAGRVESKGE